MSQSDHRKGFRPELLVRGRLLDQLAACQSRKFVLITGLPAQGKSTLVSQYVSHLGCDYHWITLDRTDAIPLYFCETLLAAIQSSLSPGNHKSHHDNLVKIDAASTQATTHYRRWALTLLREIEHPVIIVADNLEKLTPNAPTLDILEGLVSNAPETLRFIFISRALPQLKFQKLIIGGSATTLTDDDLQLTFEEFQLFWASYFGRTLPPVKERRMYDITRGWLGALALFATALDAQFTGPRECLFDRILEGRLPMEIHLYFQQEVFGPLSDKHKRYLCNIANLKPIYPSYLSDFLQNNSAHNFVEEIFSMNLFIKNRDGGDKQPCYTFHPLFRTFLIKKQKQHLGYKQRKVVYLQTARYYESIQRPEAAIDFYLKAGRRKEGHALVKQIGAQMARRCGHAQMAGWLSYFTENQIKADPWLQFFKIIVQPYEDVAIKTNPLYQVLIFFYKKGQIDAVLVCLNLVFEKIFLTSKLHVNTISLLKLAHRLLKHGNVSQHPDACARVWLQIGMANIFITGEIGKGIVACETARLLGQQIQANSIEAEAAAFISIGNAFLGRISEAEKYQCLFKTRFSGPDDRLKSIGCLSACIFELAIGVRDDFDKYLDQLVVAIEEGNLWCLYHIVTILKAVHMMFSGQLSALEDLLASFVLSLNHMPSKTLQFHVALFFAQLKYLQNDSGPARRWIKKALDIRPDFVAIGGFHHARANLLAGTIEFHEGLTSASREYLGKALGYFEKLDAPISECETSMILGILEITSGNQHSGIEHLNRAVDLINKNKFSHFFVLRPADVSLFLCVAVENEVPGIIDSIQLLVRDKQYRCEIEDRLEKKTTSCPHKIQPTIKAVRKSIYRAGLPKICITTLGAFTVRQGERLLDARQWGGLQPVNLLKAVISEGCYDVPKDLLMEELWSELDPSGMERAFKIALHRLRKGLEPGLIRRYGSSYIHFAHNRLSLDKDLIEIDINLYESCLKRACRLTANGEFDEALTFYEKADRIFNGSFLPGDLYTRWTMNKREVLTRLRVEQLFEAARILEERGQKHMAVKAYEKVLQCDQLNESAVQQLMIHYKNLGCKTLAIKVYSTFEAFMEQELDLLPADITQQLHQSIVKNC